MLCMASPAINAQSFLKKLGKAVTKAVETVVENPQQSSNNSSGNTSKSGTIPGVTMKITSVEHWGSGVRVLFSVTNTTDKALIINFDSQLGSSNEHNVIAYGTDGTSYSCRVPGFGTAEAIGYDTTCEVPAGLTIKGRMFINDVAENTNYLRQIVFGGSYHAPVSPGNMVTDAKYFRYVFSNANNQIAITTVKNTNADNVTCNLPVLNVAIGTAQRQGNNVVFNYTLTNRTDSEMRFDRLTDVTIYDTEGNKYDASLNIAGKKIGSDYTYTSLPAQIPVKCILTILNVPSTISTFRLVRLPLGNQEYRIDIKNLAITSATASTTATNKGAQVFKGKWTEKRNNGDYGTAEWNAEIDLYQAKVYPDYGETPIYGSISYCCDMKIDDHNIVKVLSINGNNAEVILECGYSGDVWKKGRLTYNPTTKALKFTDLGQVPNADNEKPDILNCFVTDITLRKKL